MKGVLGPLGTPFTVLPTFGDLSWKTAWCGCSLASRMSATTRAASLLEAANLHGYELKAQLLALLKPNQLRVLLALREHGPMRFRKLERLLGLNPAQLDRTLELLTNGVWVFATLLPPEGKRIPVEYGLGERGAAFLEAFDAFARKVRAQRRPLGEGVLGELDALGAR